MSDAARQNLKVSREGIVLIKSFEGFRPRAIQRAEGGWIIGYGHTLSAREGASVSEADAELLLRYDLLPVEKTVNDTVPQFLNQHQFDALVSFAFSVGVDRFAGSDVRQRLNAGSPGEAADAIMGWPEPVLPETALRRRAAERALFVANPAAPVALSDLLAAPLLTPAVPVADPDPVSPEPLHAEPDTADASDPKVPAPTGPREAAVAALLGEPPVVVGQDEPSSQPIIPNFATSSVPTPAPADEDRPAEDVPVEQPDPADADPVSDVALAFDEPDQPAADDFAMTEAVQPTPPVPAWTASRYSPYSLSMVGPLPYLGAATPRTEPEPSDAAATDRRATDPAPPSTETVAMSPVEAQSTPTEPDSPAVEPLDVASVPAEPIDAVPFEQPASPPAVEAFASIEPGPFDASASTAELVLTPLEDAPEPAFARPLWTPEERTETDTFENNLFGEDLTLTLGGAPIMRHEIETEAPARFDWSETGPFIFMGGVGLVSFGASMAAFRRAAEHSGGNELTVIGWVLALIGLACVGVSSVNLYRKFGLPGGD